VAEILLIAADWQFRTLVRAQLLEEGLSVRSLPSLEVALADLLRGGEQPQLTILDVEEPHTEVRQLRDLWQLTNQAPLLLCGGILNRALLERDDLPPAQVLLRPFRVGDIVERARELLTRQ
jgi:DNA-binding response OmpR family regulator